jgi:neutral ceramidase
MRPCGRSLFLFFLFLLGIALTGQAQTTKPGPLRVGAAKVDVTPAESELPKQYLGILDRVYSRAIVIDNGTTSAALVTVDVLSLSDSLWKRVSARISAELGIPVKNIVLAGTGTHSVPMNRGGAQGPGAPFEMGPAYEDKIVSSVRLAKERLQPARMSYGTGVSYLNVQRDFIDPKTHRWWEGANYDGTSDKTVAVAKFVSLTGEPIAVYYNYAIFNVITGTLDLVSGDITGATSRYIEESFDDKMVAVFSLGAHGDQNPIYFQQTFDLREIRIRDYAKRGQDISNALPPGGTGLDRQDPIVAKLMNQQKQMILSMGQLLGEEVLHAMRTAGREESTVQIYSDQKTITCPGRERTNEGRGGVAGTYKDADPAEIRIGLLMIGDIAVGQVNGNPYNEIGLRLKRESPYAKTLLATRANGMTSAGYIPDDASYGHETFAVLNSRLKPGCAETAIVEGIIDMMPPIMY